MDPGQEADALVEDWRRERPDVELDSVRVFLPLRRTLQAAEARRAVVLARHGITPAMLDMLVAVRRVGAPYTATPSELARQLVLSAGGVSQRLDRLEQLGLVERTTNTEDRRSVSVTLTAAGLRALDDLIGEYMLHEEQLLAGWSAEERAQLATLLVRLHESICSTDGNQ